MLIPTPSHYTGPRRGARRIPPPAAALAIVSVIVDSFDGADMHLRLVFNTTAAEPLADVGAADPLKWTGRMDGVSYLGDSMDLLAFDTVHLHLQGQVPSAGPDVLNYSNAPSDIADELGRQLAAFAGLPLG